MPLPTKPASAKHLASEQLEQTLITLKGVSQDDDVYIPTHAAARGGIGSFAVGMQRAGLPNLPGFAELTKRALEAKTLAASQLLGSRVGSATGGKPWHKNYIHPTDFCTTARSIRYDDIVLAPGSKWAAMSLNESDPKYIVHHLKQQRKYERRLARERQAEEERNSIKAAMRSVEQRLQFERQRLEQAHKYSASGLQPRPAYEDAELTAQHLRANGIDGSTIRGSLDLSSTARGRSAESFHEFLGGAEARSPRVSLPGTRHLRVVDRLLMEEEEEVKRAGQRAVSGRTRAQDLRAEQATLREVSDLDQFEYKLKTASTQRKHNMQYD